jgi:hypothetical protein
MSFVSELRDELVAAAEREGARRLPRIERPGPRFVLTAAAAAALALIVLLAVTALDTEPVDRGTHPAARPTPEGRELFGGQLVPDVRYRTRAFVPALSFVVGDDAWYVGETALPDALVLERRPHLEPGQFARPFGFLAFDRINEVFAPHVRGLEASRVAAPADFIGWLRKHPDLRVSAPETVQVAGTPGESVDVEVRFTRPAHSDPFCRQRFLRTCTALAPDISFFNGVRLRVVVLATEPQPLVITTGGVSERAQATVEKAAAPVLDSLRIGVR